MRLFSDLHLEFDNENEDFDPGTGDVLVLAGDVCVVRDCNNRIHKFFQKCVEGYNQVFYVLGNHEHYGGVFEDTLFKLQAKLPDKKAAYKKAQRGKKYMLFPYVH